MIDKMKSAWDCLGCGAKLEYPIDWDSRRGRFYKRCQKCRDEAYYSEAMVQRRAAQRQRKYEMKIAAEQERQREEWRRDGNRCILCGRELRAIYRAYKVCGKCMREEEEKEKMSQINLERMKTHCYNCPFKKLQGDFYSCLSVTGTGPMTRDCLKYTAGPYLRIRIVVEDEDE